MGATVSYLLMLQKISVQSKRFWNKKCSSCLGNISGNFSANNVKKTGLKKNVSDFSVGFNVIDTSNIINIHKYLMKKMIK